MNAYEATPSLWKRALDVMKLAPRVARACACVGLVGCSFFVPDTTGTPSDRARNLEPKCRSSTEEGMQPLLSPSAIDSVEPAYAYAQGGPNGRQARLRGARIHLRPLAGLSRESIARGLECHEARAVLGLSKPRGDEPYTLPERWLHIDVESEGDGFLVLVQADDPDDARRVLERARLFAATPAPP